MTNLSNGITAAFACFLAGSFVLYALASGWRHICQAWFDAGCDCSCANDTRCTCGDAYDLDEFSVRESRDSSTEGDRKAVQS